MSEIGAFVRGKRFVRNDIQESGIPCIHYGDLYTRYGISAKNTFGYISPALSSKMRFAQPNDIVIVNMGENKNDIGVGTAWLGNEPAAVHDGCFIFSTSLNPKYVSYFLRTSCYHKQILMDISEAKICSISKTTLENVKIPVPSLEEQQRIVDILDRFEALTSDLTSGLPAEIEARQQQYEYYRNKLLTFERAA